MKELWPENQQPMAAQREAQLYRTVIMISHSSSVPKHASQEEP